jgi:hypothetical protein
VRFEDIVPGDVLVIPRHLPRSNVPHISTVIMAGYGLHEYEKHLFTLGVIELSTGDFTRFSVGGDSEVYADVTVIREGEVICESRVGHKYTYST